MFTSSHAQTTILTLLSLYFLLWEKNKYVMSTVNVMNFQKWTEDKVHCDRPFHDF